MSVATTPEVAVRVGRVGIALAAYRPTVGYFGEQLASIVGQTHEDWFCVVTLDSPLDELRAEAALAGYLDDERFEWIENPVRLGHKKNFEHAIGRVAGRGAWAIATADQDDVWYPEKLATLVEALGRCARLSLVHSDMHVLIDGEVPAASVWRRTLQYTGDASVGDLLVANVVTGCSMLFDAELARRYGAIPDAFDFHDHWFAIAAACHGGVHAVDRPLLGYRQHGGNVVGAPEFDWSITLPEASGIGGEIAACRERWSMLRRRTIAAIDAGLPLPRGLVRRYRDGVDLGLILLARGLVRFVGNPRLARLCIRLAIGRLADVGARRS